MKFQFSGIYAYPVILGIHILGQILDAYLFIYLANRFFHGRAGAGESRWHTALATAGLTAVLFFTDFFTGNAFYPYYVALMVLPFLYSCLRFREKVLVKAAICSIFTTLILSLETFSVYLFWGRSLETVGLYGFLPLFFLRRIGSKAVLFLLIRHLLLWTKEANIEMPVPSLVLLLVVSVGDSVILALYALPMAQRSYGAQLALIVFLLVIPMLLLLLTKYLCMNGERMRVMNAQIAQMKVLEQYQEQQAEFIDSLRQFRHDYKAHLFAMDALLQAGQYEDLHAYLLKLHQYQYEGLQLRKFSDDTMLDIILNQKMAVAQKLGIDFAVDVLLKDRGRVEALDLNSILMNLIDNAIEACWSLPDARISLKMHPVKAYLVIEISNTCKGDVMKLNPEMKSSKGKSEYHGLGIRIIKSIVEKYQGEYRVHSTENQFTTIVYLPDE